METSARTIGLSLAFGGLLIVLDTTVTVVALPAMVSGLGSSLPALQWVTTGYILGLVTTTPLAGWLAVRHGDRRVYLTALVFFVLASAGCGAAWNAGSLIVLRVLQGFAGGLINPVGMAIALRSTPQEYRGAMMSLLGLPVVIGPVLGPPLAGLLVDAASWRWVFWLNLPLGLAAYLICWRILPGATHSPQAVGTGEADLVGLAQVTTGGVLLVLGCTVVGEAGRMTPGAWGTVLAGALLLGLFARHNLRSRSPLVRVDLLRRRPVAAGAVVLATFSAAYFGSLTILPVVVQGVRGDSVAKAGSLAIPTGLAVGITLQVATRLIDRIDPRKVVMTGTALTVLAMVLLGWAVSRDASYSLLGTLGAVLGVGSGATIMPTMTNALRGLEGTEIAQGTTLLNLISQLSNALGTALIATSITVTTASHTPQLGPGGLEAMIELDQVQRAQLSAGLADALGATYLLPAALAAAALIAAVLLMSSVNESHY